MQMSSLVEDRRGAAWHKKGLRKCLGRGCSPSEGGDWVVIIMCRGFALTISV